ncbi:MAG TPA: DUF5658 family protein [Gammaproteobacteria bacterium]|jgi:hypothetical protein
MSVSCDQEPPASGTTPPPFEERRVATSERRALTLRTLFASGFSPRRRTGRRASDHELPVDFHDRRLLAPVVAMLMLSIIDGFLTVRLMSDGARETNPLLAFVLTEHPGLFAAVKMGLTGLGTMLLVALARARVFKVLRVSAFLYGLLAAYFCLVAYEAWLMSAM